MTSKRTPIKLVNSTFYNEAETKQKLAEFILGTSMLSMGEQTAKFESAFAKKQGRQFAVLVNSGSSANLILLQALLNLGRVRAGAAVGISSLTWATNVMPVIQLGLKPVAIDVSKNTLNVSPETLSAHLREIDALFLTNALGFSDDIGRIREACASEGITLIEDNCESLGSRVSGALLGNFGLASTFSFFVAHHLSTIEGGMVCTDDEDLYCALIMARSHGWNRNLPDRKKDELRTRYGDDEFFSKYSFYELAYNVRPTDINAFIGNTQLQYWDVIVEARERNFRRFHDAVLKNPDLLPLDIEHMDVVSNFAMPLIAKDFETFTAYKRRFIESGVEIRPIIAGDITKQPFYRKHVADTREQPNAHFIHAHGLYFANNPNLNEADLQFLTSLLERR